MTKNFNTHCFGKYICVLFVGLFSFLSMTSWAQTNFGNDFATAKQLFSEKNYTAARTLLQSAAVRSDLIHASEANAYLMQCDLYLNKDGASDAIQHYLDNNPKNNYANELRYALAQNYYNDKDYKNAALQYRQCDVNRLKDSQQQEFYFKSAYSELQNKQIDRAEQNFALSNALTGSFNEETKYYYAYTLFVNKKYEEARKQFEDIPEGSKYASWTPYYLSSIYFEQAKYDNSITAGNSYLAQKGELDQQQAILRILGLAYYQQSNYEQAVNYLEQFKAAKGVLQRDDIYTLAMAHYQLNHYDNAIAYFNQVISYKDELAQSSELFLGHCYLKQNKHDEAKTSYQKAGQMDYDVQVKEQAFYNYLKLSYETAHSGDQQLLNDFQVYFKKFPNSLHSDELNELLLSYMSENKMYETAYQLILRNKNPSTSMQRTLQSVAYWRGVDNYEKNDFPTAVTSFSTSLAHGEYDAKLKALALYWRAESNYRLGNKTDAQRDYTAFLSQKEAPLTDIYSMAYYSLAYCQFGDQKYVESKMNFQRFVALSSNDDKMKNSLSDAYNRMGDCDFLQRQFDQALVSYNWVINKGGLFGIDYALFQRAFIYGLNKQEAKKISELKSLVYNYPNSSYADDAQYEIGKTYSNDNDWKKAIEAYNSVITNYPKENTVSKALLQRSLAYYNLNDKEEAKASYKTIVEKYPNTPEAEMALAGLKNIAVEQNKVSEYITYVNQLGNVKINASEEDELTFRSAEKRYMNGDIQGAKDDFTHYINQFPKGAYLANAYFYRADGYAKNKQTDEALKDYITVIEQAQNVFTEDALSHASILLMNENKYTEALDYYKQLEQMAQNQANKLDARLGQLRCNYALQQWTAVLSSAGKLETEKELRDADRQELYFKEAKSQLALGQVDQAKLNFLKVNNSLSTPESAESQFRLAQIEYGKKDVKAAQKRIADFIKKGSPYPYWLAQNFILLADINSAQGNDFQAKQYLLNLKANYKTADDIQVQVDQRLSKLQNIPTK